MSDTERLQERVETLEATVSDLHQRLHEAVNRDIPLMKGTIRALLDADIEEINELPDAGRSFHHRVDAYDDRLATLETRVQRFDDISGEQSSKEQKIAAVLSYAVNKCGPGQRKVAVTATEIKGVAGVSRRYAYDLVEAIADELSECELREGETVQTSSGPKHKSKAVIVDCELVHEDGRSVNSFTTGDGPRVGTDESGTTEEVHH